MPENARTASHVQQLHEIAQRLIATADHMGLTIEIVDHEVRVIPKPYQGEKSE